MTQNPYGAAHVARQAKWFAVAKAGSAFIALAWQFVLVRGLTVVDYASFTVFLAANSVLVFLTLFGLDRVVYRAVPPLRAALRWRELACLMLGFSLVRGLCIAGLLLLVWALGQRLLPAQLYAETQRLPWQYLAFSFATGFTDSFAVYANSLGRQGRQAMLLMGATFLRMLLVVAAIWHGGFALATAADIMVATEFLLAAALLVVLARELAGLRRQAPPAGGPLQWGFSLRALVRDSLSTQLTYMVGLPFRGALLRLIVGAVASPLVVAAFGFFQALSDRAYQFMPVFLMKGMLEPAMASDFAQRRDYERIRLVLRLVLRLNYLILALGLCLLIGSGAPLIDWVTHGRYGGETMLAVLILLQLGAMTLGESLWMGLNPIGRLAYHNKVWLYVSLLCYLGVAAAAAARSPAALLLVAVLPYGMVFAWLRWVSGEPFLQGGLGLEQLWRLAPPLLGGIAVARAILWYSSALPALVLSVMMASVVFAGLARAMGLFDPRELEQVAAISPRLARLLRWVSA
ncbi:lipopolysaccharide biosynthesis protein [Massilia sp. erpn]|uniref:lipopolysaccharide biosynthesis protein n=1 Tax=Massilia sp. erpn TaxID=2738142 RepID=UPI0021039D4D|nr:hypothetical protein [Massilia sp. erpn]UTY55787.1 hypothetical protein HPQ68_00460 [Massilia sp. erpn]